MAVTEVRLVEVDGGIGQRASRRYRMVYHVDTDDKNDGPITARLAAGLPARLSNFSYGNDIDPGAVCYDKRAKLLNREETYQKWEVVCLFGTSDVAITGITEDEVDDPILKPAHWSGNYIQYTRPYPRDKDDAAIKNTAGDPFVDPPVVGDDSRLALIVQKNFNAINLSLWAQFRDAVNNASWWGLSARKIKVQRIQFDEGFFNGVVYYPVTFEFHINDDTWDVNTLNAGFRSKSSTPKRITMPGSPDTPVVRPWPLDSSGDALSQADINSGNETYVTSKIYNEKDFSLLGLPSVLGGP